MKVVIEVPDDFYWRMKYQNGMSVSEAEVVVNAFYNSLIVSDELHILTKEAYSDLCIRASKEPKVGKWIEGKRGLHLCSVCGHYASWYEYGDEEDLSDYCPNCGAKMGGASNE